MVEYLPSKQAVASSSLVVRSILFSPLISRMKNFLILVFLFFPLGISAKLRISPLFSENCVLQRGKTIKIFGVDSPSSVIKVELLGKKFTCIADHEGKWIANISLPENTSGGPFKLKVSNQNETFENKKVYIGDVWLASGQSNMEKNVDAVENSEFLIKDADNYKNKIFRIRILGNTKAAATDFRTPIEGLWQETNSTNVQSFSALAHLFAKEIYKDQKVPIGIIESIWGNTPIQAWMSKEALDKSFYTDYHSYPKELWCQTVFTIEAKQGMESLLATLCLGANLRPQFTAWLNNHKLVNEAGFNCHSIPMINLIGSDAIKLRQRAENVDDKFIESVKEDLKHSYLSLGGNKTPINMWFHEIDIDPRTETVVFNGIVSPLSPYEIKGVLWYQGENNLRDYQSYAIWFKNMVEDWRHRWNKDLPFLTVQLSTYKSDEGSDYLSRFREVQEKITALVPNTYIATSIDLGNTDQAIHTLKKEELGHRLALLALRKIYGHKNIKYNHPSPRKITPIFGSLKIDFGLDKLVCKNTCPNANQLSQDFLVAGEDKIYYPAQIKISDHSLLASSPQVKNPRFIRYAWSDTPSEFIYNEIGLPIMPFRNDNW